MYGLSSMTAPLHRVAVRAPGSAMLAADAQAWHYGPRFDREKVAGNHAAFCELLAAAGIELLWMNGDERGIADAVFTYDASLMTPEGAILMSPGKPLRAGEQALHRAFYQAEGIPILGEIQGEGRAEGGDTLWLDARTLAIGRGFRTNDQGIAQIAALLRPLGVEVLAFDLPVYGGAAACMHLMSLVSLVDRDKALVCARLMPVALWQKLEALGFQLIEAPYHEFQASGTLSLNVLATAPGRCIMIDGFPETRQALEAAGIAVSVFDGAALCIGCEGGPTCMTRPIHRV
ncbi:MAG: arginine deiminase family protein [Pseudomonadota bacterium]